MKLLSTKLSLLLLKLKKNLSSYFIKIWQKYTNFKSIQSILVTFQLKKIGAFIFASSFPKEVVQIVGSEYSDSECSNSCFGGFSSLF
jgi:hypothetical protein